MCRDETFEKETYQKYFYLSFNRFIVFNEDTPFSVYERDRFRGRDRSMRHAFTSATSISFLVSRLSSNGRTWYAIYLQPRSLTHLYRSY